MQDSSKEPPPLPSIQRDVVINYGRIIQILIWQKLETCGGSYHPNGSTRGKRQAFDRDVVYNYFSSFLNYN